MNSVGILLLVCSALAAIIGGIACRSKTCNSHTAMYRDTMRSKEDWKEIIGATSFVDHDLAKLDNTLTGYYLDRAFLHWGGTGLKDVYYLVKNKLQIRATLDRNDVIVNEPEVEDAGEWKRAPDGSLESTPLKRMVGP